MRPAAEEGDDGMIPHTNIEALRKKYASDNFLAFSADIDWASDACIEKQLGFFLARGVPMTVFCTHASAAIDRLRGDARVELGIHPNFSAGSSQGATLDEVLDTCFGLVPGARCMRGHRWYSSNDVSDRLVERGVLFDSNECSMLDPVAPYIHRSGLLRIPVYFEDGGFLWNGAEVNFKTNGRRYFDTPGLKVLDLHPIHFALNCPSNEFYRTVADTTPRAVYSAMDDDAIAARAWRGYGMRDYLTELMDFAVAAHVNVVSLGQVYDELRRE